MKCLGGRNLCPVRKNQDSCGLSTKCQEAAKLHLLGCQLEQSLLGDDAQRAGDSVGEAQHGQAAGQIGIYSGLLAILCWAAERPPLPEAPPLAEPAPLPQAPPPAAAPQPANVGLPSIVIKVADVELAEIVIRISLLLKKELRKVDGETIPMGDTGVDQYAMAPNRAVVVNLDGAAFARPYDTQADALTQVAAVEVGLGSHFGEGPEEECAEDFQEDRAAEHEEEAPADEDDGVSEGLDGGGRAPGNEVAEGDAGPPAPGDEAVPDPVVVVQFEDLKPDDQFWADGFGTEGVHLLKQPTEDQPLIQDRRLLQKLFQQGKDKFEVEKVANMQHTPPGGGKDNRRRVNAVFVRSLFTAFADAFRVIFQSYPYPPS